MATRSEQPATPDRRHELGRRQFLHWLAGAAGLALLVRSAHAAPLPGEPAADLPPAGETQQWRPGPDWERVPPSKLGGVGGWRNKKNGDFMTDWFPRSRGATGLDASKLSLDPQVLLHGGWDAKARLWVISPGCKRIAIESIIPSGDFLRS